MEVEGVVVKGDCRGRLLGFPTANLDATGVEGLPEDGVYAGWVELGDGAVYIAAISVGRRPMYYGADGSLVVEAFLLDFDGDLYGELIRVHIGERIRGQERFSSEDEFVARMRTDVETVRAAGEDQLLRPDPGDTGSSARAEPGNHS